MSVIKEAEELALSLSVSDRAKLASRLLRSLPPITDDDDDGFKIAAERDRAMDADPSRGMTLEEFDQKLTHRFPYLKHETHTRS